MKLTTLSGQTYPILGVSSASVYFDKVCAINEPLLIVTQWTLIFALFRLLQALLLLRDFID